MNKWFGEQQQQQQIQKTVYELKWDWFIQNKQSVCVLYMPMFTKSIQTLRSHIVSGFFRIQLFNIRNTLYM